MVSSHQVPHDIAFKLSHKLVEIDTSQPNNFITIVCLLIEKVGQMICSEYLLKFSNTIKYQISHVELTDHHHHHDHIPPGL